MNENKDQQNPPTSQESPRKQNISIIGSGSTTNERLKRDEWSEGAVTTLLEAYESKWILRNRAKLKGQDWEDVAKHVSSRSNSTKSPKTQTQCKNKIESMKKRYRSESASSDVSAWPLYSRLDLLLRGTGQLSTTTTVVASQLQHDKKKLISH
ncbi:trihelix transcription factor ASIL2 [Trifolium pratense]|uniref:Trihelix transcription factor ASIL2 n=1 Tax=Trifolium pratense TaxID=57577 RepID=A0A2K3PNI3_TRIPR|nr:trihelix transcription factor ASIL2 [Trifolium pratense]